jgi:CheY-like chemotaxis protein
MQAWLRAVLVPIALPLTVVADGVDLLHGLAAAPPPDLVVAQASLPVVGGAQVMASARTAGFAAPFILLAALPTMELRALVSRRALERPRLYLLRGRDPGDRLLLAHVDHRAPAARGTGLPPPGRDQHGPGQVGPLGDLGRA